MLRGDSFFFTSLYFLLSPKKTAAAPNPARSPINGAGDAGVCVGVVTGDTVGMICPGSSAVGVGVGVGSVVAGSQMDAP